MSGRNRAGLMSSAGLVRYFDAEDQRAIRMDPRSVLIASVLFGVFVQMVTIVI